MTKNQSFENTGMQTVKFYPTGAGPGTRVNINDSFTGKFKDLVMINLLITKGCNFRCSYCQPAGSLIRMADYSLKPIEDIKIGDSVLGFDETSQGTGKKRLVYPTKVTNTGNRISKHYYDVKLANGKINQLTGEHPALAGYTYNTGKKWLTIDKLNSDNNYLSHIPIVDNELLISKDYAIGYVVSALMGDGHISKCKDGNGYDKYHVRFVVKDQDINDMFEKYCIYLGVKNFNKYNFCISKRYNEFRDSLTIQSKSGYEYFRNLIDNNLNKNTNIEYLKGFLAGIYDTEGSIANKNNIIRIYNADLRIIQEVKTGLDRINIPYIVEDLPPSKNVSVKSIRILNKDQVNSLNFILNVKPACFRKGIVNFENTNILKNIKIDSISKIDKEIKVYNFETESHTYVSDTLAVHNCVEDKDLPETSTWTLDKMDQLATWIRDQGITEKVVISFFGGEPLMEWKLMQDIVTHCVPKYNDIMEFNISTNIVLLNRAKQQWLYDNCPINGISFLLSLDGFEGVKSRVSKGNSNDNQMKTIVRNLDIMKNEFPTLMSRSSFRVSVMPEYIHELGVDLPRMLTYKPENIIIHPVTTEPTALWTEDKYSMLTDLINDLCVIAIEEGNTVIECMEGVSKRTHNCGAGHSMLAMNADGRIYSCYFTAHAEMDEDIVGNFITGTADKRIANIYVQNPNSDPKCSSCDKKYCFQCSVKNLLHSGQHFCSSLWCKELADLYTNTLEMCELTLINKSISKDNNKFSYEDAYRELSCVLNDISGLTNSLIQNQPYKGGHCGCEEINEVDGIAVSYVKLIKDYDTVKLALEAIHNQKFPNHQVSSFK